MADARWTVPQTEEGLQTLLARLEESRAAGDEAAVAYGLLALGYQVKWVRSDDDQAPFDRAHGLAQEALEIFRRLNDVPGQVRALHDVAPFVPLDERGRLLAEADRLAMASGDELLVARSLAAQARATGLKDREVATRLAREALAIFLRRGETRSAAATLFGLALYPTDAQEKLDAALESARLFREVGEHGHAGRSSSYAFTLGEGILSPGELETLAQQTLADAQADGSRSLEGIAYGHLAQTAETQGESEAAARYHRWQEEIKSADGLTPEERREIDIEFTREMIALSRAQGDAEAVRMFEAGLKLLEGE